MTGEVEARVIAWACTKPPGGYDRWSLRLLEQHVLLTDAIPPLDHSTIGRVLKKGGLRSHLKKCWTIPPHTSGEFVARIKDVPKVHHRQFDPAVPVVCMDDNPYQHLSHAALPTTLNAARY